MKTVTSSVKVMVSCCCQLVTYQSLRVTTLRSTRIPKSLEIWPEIHWDVSEDGVRLFLRGKVVHNNILEFRGSSSLCPGRHLASRLVVK
jgi:hypothetical protein